MKELMLSLSGLVLGLMLGSAVTPTFKAKGYNEGWQEGWNDGLSHQSLYSDKLFPQFQAEQKSASNLGYMAGYIDGKFNLPYARTNK